MLSSQCFSFQRGPNQEPYAAAVFVAIIAVSFIMIGNLNALAPIVTMPFLLTYAAIDYAYFKLAMSYDIRQQQKLAERKPQDLKKSAETQLISSENKGNGKKTSYGSSTFEKHDFGELIQQDAMEKDDSQEKENVHKDDNFSDHSSPLDMGENTGETKVDVQAEDAGVEGGDVDDDTTNLIEKQSNELRNRQEETKDTKYYKAEAHEERKRKNFLESSLFSHDVSARGTGCSAIKSARDTWKDSTW